MTVSITPTGPVVSLGTWAALAAERFTRANQVAGRGDHDYAIQLLLACCKMDPSHLVYRHTLRRTQKARLDNNRRGSPFAAIRNIIPKARLKRALRSGDFLRVLELGEEILVRNPWDLRTQMQMAVAADSLAMLDMAVWMLEQARHRDGRNTNLCRALARLYEKRGNFASAIALWDQVRQTEPLDVEARHKIKELAASETISRGGYGREIPSDGAENIESPTNATYDSVTDDQTAVAPTDRAAREAAPLLAKIAETPADPTNYLQLALVYSRAGRAEENPRSLGGRHPRDRRQYPDSHRVDRTRSRNRPPPIGRSRPRN